MRSLPLRLLATISLVCLVTVSASAQQGGGGTGGGGGGIGGGGDDGNTGGQGANFGTGTGTGTDQGSGGGETTSMLDAEAIFSNVERDGTVGSSGSTGAGPRATTSAGGLGGGGGGGIGGLGGLGGVGGLGGFGNLFGGAGAGSQTTRRPIRTKLRSAIRIAPRPAQQIQDTANLRLQTLPSLPSSPAVRGVRVDMRQRTAVISGVVSSERDRRMTELLMRLEPGVSRVENRLTVSP